MTFGSTLYRIGGEQSMKFFAYRRDRRFSPCVNTVEVCIIKLKRDDTHALNLLKGDKHLSIEANS